MFVNIFLSKASSPVRSSSGESEDDTVYLWPCLGDTFCLMGSQWLMTSSKVTGSKQAVIATLYMAVASIGLETNIELMPQCKDCIESYKIGAYWHSSCCWFHQMKTMLRHTLPMHSPGAQMTCTGNCW